MKPNTSLPLSLQEWLDKIQQVHPVKWDLGLARVKEVATRLKVLQPAKKVILVAGTNGKGSTCECIAQLCRTMGISYGKTTSPFLMSYREQFDINGELASNEKIIAAFEKIEQTRGDITLTYFEFSALVAFILFAEAKVEVGIVEIGLGGRLDAMNVLTPALSIITHIDLDHQDYLGDTREQIGLEKAGIFRSQSPILIVDTDPPATVLKEVDRLGCEALVLGRGLELNDGLLSWQAASLKTVLPPSSLHPASRSAAVAAIWMLGYRPEQSQIDKALTKVSLAGRFQLVEQDGHSTILDVAHNPNAAQRLFLLLNETNRTQNHAVIAMYGDKDIEGVFRQLAPAIKTWHLCDMGLDRSANIEQLRAAIPTGKDAQVQVYGSARLAYDGAIAAVQDIGALDDESILVFGSFPVVADVLTYIQDSDNQSNQSDGTGLNA